MNCHPTKKKNLAGNLHRVSTILSDKTGRAEFRVKTRDKPVNRESGTDPSSIASATEENGQPVLAPVTVQRQEQEGLRKGKASVGVSTFPFEAPISSLEKAAG